MKLFRLALLSIAIAAFSFLPARAQDPQKQTGAVSLAAISDWLNGLKTARAKITQINPDGSISTGILYIFRPGRMRFEYDPPNAGLVIAGGGSVAIFDFKSNEPPQEFPLRRTPLSVILARKVDLARSGMISDYKSDGVTTTIRARDPKRPEIGSIDLVFTNNPVELRQWVITDEGGGRTTVILGQLQTGIELPDSLFSVPLEMMKLNDNDR